MAAAAERGRGEDKRAKEPRSKDRKVNKNSKRTNYKFKCASITNLIVTRGSMMHDPSMEPSTLHLPTCPPAHTPRFSRLTQHSSDQLVDI